MVDDPFAENFELSLELAKKWQKHFANLGLKTEIFGGSTRFVSINLEGATCIHIACRTLFNKIEYSLSSYKKSPIYRGYNCKDEHEMLTLVSRWIWEE